MKKYNSIKVLFVLSFILSVICSLFVPASAADEPSESDQVIIPAGVYRFNDQLDLSFTGVQIPLNFTIQSVTIDLDGSSIVFPELTVFDHITITNQAVAYVSLVNGVSQASYYLADSYGWDSTYYAMAAQGFAYPQVLGIGQTITITSSSSVDSTFAEWFFANTTSDLPPGDDYIINAGFYKARDNWTTAGWPVTDDSIDFRYYSPYQQTYIEAEGMAFLIENDIVSIWYMDDNVYADGWNNDAATNIEVTSDISVEPEFYTVFNNIFAPSTQGSNDFDSGYAAGYDDGFSVGLDAGYTQGYYDGMADSSGNFFTDILGGVLGSLDAFTLFGGYSLLDLITTLLGGFALIWILKLLAGG